MEVKIEKFYAFIIAKYLYSSIFLYLEKHSFPISFGLTLEV